MMEPQTTPCDIFLSYHWRDHDAVEHLARALDVRGLRVFLDRWYLAPGLPWPQALEHALERCRAVAVCIGPGGMGPWQMREQFLALVRQVEEERRGLAFPVIPVLLPGAELPLCFLRLNTWVSLRAGVEDAQAVEAIARAARGLPPEAVRARPAVCPYRGLQAFREEDAPLFFGREDFSDRLIEEIRGKSFIAVVGASGSGKSSVVRAGLVPRLRRARSGEAPVWDILTLTPHKQPLDSLAEAILRVLEPAPMSEAKRLAELDLLVQQFAAQPRALQRAARRCIEKQPGTDRLLLFVDQWEELYTTCQDESARRVFIDQLLAASADAPVTVVLTLRGDFYGRALTHRGLGDRLQDCVVNLGPMTRGELRRTIENPAGEVGLEFEPGLVDHILDEVGDEPGNLPLLEFTLKELWENRRGHLLHFEAYKNMEGIQGAIAVRADRICQEELTDEQREAARRVLMRLVRPGEGTPDTRRRAMLPAEDENALAVIHKLADARLLITGHDEVRTDARTVEIAHEALIQHWSLLRRWIDEDREFLRTRERVEAAAVLWEQEGKVEDRLLTRGRPLAEAEDLLAKRRADLSPSLIDFIEASTAAERRRQEALQEAEREAQRQKLRRNRLIAVASVLIAVTMAGLGLFAVDRWRTADRATEEVRASKEAKEQERRKALSRALSAQASLLVERGPSEETLLRAGTLAVESWNREPNPDAYSVAMKVLEWFPVRRIEPEPQSLTSARVLFSPNGRFLAIDFPFYLLRVVETETGREVMRIQNVENDIPFFTFSADSHFLIRLGRDRQRIIHIESGKEVHSVSEGKFPFHNTANKVGGLRCLATMSPDGRWLASTTADAEGRTDGITVVDMKTGTEACRVEHQLESREAVLGLAFSPDGTCLVIIDYRVGLVRLIEVPGGNEKARFKIGDAYTVDFIQDGGYLVIEAHGSNPGFHFIDPKSGTLLNSIHFREKGEGELSGDARRAVTVDANQVRLFEVPSGKEVARWQEGSLRASFDRSGQRLIIENKSGLIRLVDSASGMEKSRVELGCGTDGWGRAEYRREDDSLILLCSNKVEDKGKVEVRTLDVSTGEESARFTIDGWTPFFSPDVRLVVNQAKDLEVLRFHETQTGEELARFATNGVRIQPFANTGPGLFPGQLTFSLDGRYVAIPSPTGSVRLADLSSSHSPLRLEAVCKGSFVISRGRRFLAFDGLDRVVRVVDMTTGREVGNLRHDNRIYIVNISSDGRFLTTEQEAVLKINEIETGLEVAHLQRNSGKPSDIDISPDGQYLGINNYKGSASGLVSSSSLKEVLQYPSMQSCGDSAFSPDGRWFVMANLFQDFVQVFDTVSGAEAWRITSDSPESHPRPCSPKFSPDGQSLALRMFGKMHLYDVATQKDKPRLKHRYSCAYGNGSQTAHEPGFSPDGRTLALGGDEDDSGAGLTVELFDVETEKELVHLHSGSWGSGGRTQRLYEFKFAFTPDSRLFAAGAAVGDPVRLFDARTGKELAHLELGWGLKGVLFSPDGRSLAAASNNGSVRLLDVKELRVLGASQHAKGVTHMEFSPDNRFLVTSSQDGTALMMETETGKTVARFEHGEPLFQANFSHDGQSVLTVSADRLKLWHADPKWPFEQLCERSGRNLSREEWRTFIGESEDWRPTCPNWHTPDIAASAAGLPPIGP